MRSKSRFEGRWEIDDNEMASSGTYLDLGIRTAFTSSMTRIRSSCSLTNVVTTAKVIVSRSLLYCEREVDDSESGPSAGF